MVTFDDVTDIKSVEKPDRPLLPQCLQTPNVGHIAR